MFTGLLASGGGFLLVPVCLLMFGLRMRQAVGISLVVIAVLAIPAVHWARGHIGWPLAGEFAAGLLPGGAVGSRLAHRVQGPVLQKAFGWFLIAFGMSFTIYRVAGG